jgi:hypothetical protein
MVDEKKSKNKERLRDKLATKTRERNRGWIRHKKGEETKGSAELIIFYKDYI